MPQAKDIATRHLSRIAESAALPNSSPIAPTRPFRLVKRPKKALTGGKYPPGANARSGDGNPRQGLGKGTSCPKNFPMCATKGGLHNYNDGSVVTPPRCPMGEFNQYRTYQSRVSRQIPRPTITCRLLSVPNTSLMAAHDITDNMALHGIPD